MILDMILDLSLMYEMKTGKSVEYIALNRKVIRRIRKSMETLYLEPFDKLFGAKVLINASNFTVYLWSIEDIPDHLIQYNIAIGEFNGK